jgi:uncharacterized protein (DUF1800 family)
MPQHSPLSEADAAHLFRRAGFGPARGEAARWAGRRRSDAVRALLAPRASTARGPAGARNGARELERLQLWWLGRMRMGTYRLHEKMALFWHDHFPSSFTTVPDVTALALQNATFRKFGLGSFRELLYQVTVDPAMLQFLDGAQNRVGAPNENYARELMELFTLGPLDANGVPNYTQADVSELARALTGYFIQYRGSRRTVGRFYWYSDRGDKRLFAGKPFEAFGDLGVEESDGTRFPPERNVIDLLFLHRDSDGRPTLARFIARKLWEWFGYPGPALALVDELADAFVAGGYVLADLVSAILLHDEMYSERARDALAKTPVDFALQALLALGVRGTPEELAEDLRAMGMELFQPPGVNGWSHGDAWLSTSRTLARMSFAQKVASSRGGRDPYPFPAASFVRAGEEAGRVVERVLAQLALSPSDACRQALADYLSTGDPVDKRGDWFETKCRGLFALALALPEFQVH